MWDEITLIPGEGDPAFVIDRVAWDRFSEKLIGRVVEPCPFALILMICDGGTIGYINRIGRRLWLGDAGGFRQIDQLSNRPVILQTRRK